MYADMGVRNTGNFLWFVSIVIDFIYMYSTILNTSTISMVAEQVGIDNFFGLAGSAG